jgi:plasmid stabilization system protein ParE
VTTKFTVTLLPEAVADLRRLEDFAIERKLASDSPDWTPAQRALDAIREGMRLLSWSPYSCRRAELGNGRSRELIVPFGGTGCIVLFAIVDDVVVIGAVRHQREEDYRH